MSYLEDGEEGGSCEKEFILRFFGGIVNVVECLMVDWGFLNEESLVGFKEDVIVGLVVIDEVMVCSFG
jgi:hypothetical protein